MQSKFYQTDEHRAEKVRELFATIAHRYDVLNDIMSAGLHRRWKRHLVEMAVGNRRLESAEPKAESRERNRVLDLCCGTGDIALLFVRKGSWVAGADFSDEMLRVAERRCRAGVSPTREIGDENVRASRPPHLFWVRSDALQLPFPDGSFDIVSVGYGLRNLADLERGLREILRVLRPGGKLLSLDFGKPASNALRMIYFGYLRTILPILGRVWCGDADTYGYILVSLQAYPAQRGTNELMESCGFEECGFEEYLGGTMAINFGSKPG